MGKSRNTKWRKKTANLHLNPKDLINDIERKTISQKSKKYVKKNIGKLYTISKEKNIKGIHLQKKIEKANKKSLYEERRVNTLSKRLIKKKIQKRQKPKISKQKKKNAEIFDLWGKSEKKVEKTKKQKLDEFSTLVTNPGVIIPGSGESYNPSLNAHTKKLERFVEDNLEEEKKIKVKEIVLKRNQKKVEKMKIVFAEKNRKMKLKQMDDFDRLHHLEDKYKNEKKKREKEGLNYEKDFKRKVKELQNKKKELQNRKKKNEKRQQKIKKGEIQNYSLKISKHKLPKNNDYGVFHPDDLPENLKNVETQEDGIRERFESIYRRGLIEYKPGMKNQKRRKIKFHNKRNGKQDFFVYE